MQEPGGVMVWLAENIQACLRIFRRTQHQWLARDILHQPQGVFIVFVLCPTEGTEVRLISWHIARILNPFTYYLNFPSAPRIAQNPPRSTSLEFERCRKYPKMTMICQDNRKIFPWSVDQRCYGRSTRHPMVGRASTLWSVDHRPYGRSTKRTLNEMDQKLSRRSMIFCTKGPKCAILIF